VNWPESELALIVPGQAAWKQADWCIGPYLAPFRFRK
jgi:hypothetical protein